jgi:hypothetical protein
MSFKNGYPLILLLMICVIILVLRTWRLFWKKYLFYFHVHPRNVSNQNHQAQWIYHATCFTLCKISGWQNYSEHDRFVWNVVFHLRGKVLLFPSIPFLLEASEPWNIAFMQWLNVRSGTVCLRTHETERALCVLLHLILAGLYLDKNSGKRC